MSTSSERRDTRRTVFLLAIAVGTIMLGCAQAPDRTSTGGDAKGGAAGDLTGTVGMRLTLPDGVQLDSVAWAITGPDGASTSIESGRVSIPNSGTLRFLVGGVPAGKGFDISLSGTSLNGSVTCAGSASFDVAAQGVTNVSVALGCTTLEADGGSTVISASAYDCASVHSVTANPAKTSIGEVLAVTGTADGPNAGGLTYAWSASSGSFDTPTAATANFTCTVAGPATLTLTATDGPLPESGPCDPSLATMSIQVQCNPLADGGVTSNVDAAPSWDVAPVLDAMPDAADAGEAASPEAGSDSPMEGTGEGTVVASGVTFTAQENVSFDGPLADFTASDQADPASEFAVSIEWGDGSPPTLGTVTGSSGTFVASGTHTYTTTGPVTVTVWITDSLGNATAIANSMANVSPGPT